MSGDDLPPMYKTKAQAQVDLREMLEKYFMEILPAWRFSPEAFTVVVTEDCDLKNPLINIAVYPTGMPEKPKN